MKAHKRGGIYFFRVGRIGGSLFVAKKPDYRTDIGLAEYSLLIATTLAVAYGSWGAVYFY